MNDKYCFSEKQIINSAIQHVKSNTASKEEKLLVKLYLDKTTKFIDDIFYNISPKDSKSDNIVECFQELENSYRKVYNILYEHCGMYDDYVNDFLFDYLADVYINKLPTFDKKHPTRTFILLVVIRNEMESGKWYTLNDMLDIIKNEYPEYDGIIKKENFMLLVTACEQEGFFESKEEKHMPRGKVIKRYFKKTDKDYLDFKIEMVKH